MIPAKIFLVALLRRHRQAARRGWLRDILGEPKADMGIADNEAGLALFRFCHVYGLVKRLLAAVAVNWADNLPAICHEALPNIFVKPGINIWPSIETPVGNHRGKISLPRPQVPAKGGCLVGDAFRQDSHRRKSRYND